MNERITTPNTYYMPTRVHFGQQVVAHFGTELTAFGQRALIVSGRHSADQSGAIADLLPVLDQLGIGYERFNEIPENPDWGTIDRACEQFLQMRAEFVIGIGGGSPLDAAKAIAILCKHGYGETPRPNLAGTTDGFPIVAIPTTSGTGSEVTPHSVLTDLSLRRKGGFTADAAFPRVAFVDPRYTLSLPSIPTRNTAIDALSHLLEGIYSNRRDPMLYPLIHEGVALIVKHLPLALQHPESYTSREALSRAALLGGMVIANTGTTFQHAIGYPLTMEFGLAHGLANGVVMRQVMELYYPAIEPELNLLFRHLGITYGELFQWLDGLDMHVDHPIAGDFLDERVPEVLKARNSGNSPIAITDAHVRRIYSQLQ